jgi:hypothetical protein
MAWRLEGTYFENCNCEGACPCTVSSFQLPAHNERCTVVLAFHVDRGEIDGVGVDDLSVVLLGDAPQQMTDGNWSVGLYVDERASGDQAEKLGAVFSGQVGGPFALLAPLIGEVLGLEQVPIEYVDDARLHRLRIGDRIEVEIEDIQADGHDQPTRVVGIQHPANSTVTLSTTRRSRVDAFGIRFEGSAGSSAPFAWAG